MKIRIACQGAAVLELDQITEFQGELKSLSKADHARLKKEILETGFSSPIHVWKNGGHNYCLDGHQRLRTLKNMAAKDGVEVPPLPVIWVQAKDEREAKRKILSLTSQYGRMEPDGLYQFMSEAGFSLPEIESSFRFPEIDFPVFAQEYFKENTKDDEVPDPPKNPISKPGDLWILGDHKILCGDSTKAEDVARVMHGEKAVLMATDPPYMVNYGKWESTTLNRKDWSGTYHEITEDALETALKLGAEVTTQDAAIYVWHADSKSGILRGIFDRLDFLWHQTITWVKPSPIPTHMVYLVQHEPCAFGWKRGTKARLPLGGQGTAGSGKDWSTIWQISWDGMGRPPVDRGHPTMKPTETAIRPIELHTNPGELVYEPFSGSGTQIIAAEKLGRRCFAIEISGQYCDVAVMRWETFTGRKAEKA